MIGGLAVLLLWALSRTDWTPGAPLRVARRRVWGQTMASSGRMMWRHPRIFLGIGLLFVPLGILTTLLQYLIFQVTALAPLVNEAGQRNPMSTRWRSASACCSRSSASP